MVVAFQLDVHPGTGQRGKHVVQPRDGVQRERRGVEAVHAHRHALDAGEGVVVEDDRDAVARQPDVELRPVAAGNPHRGLEGRQGVSGATRQSPRCARRSMREGAGAVIR